MRAEYPVPLRREMNLFTLANGGARRRVDLDRVIATSERNIQAQGRSETENPLHRSSEGCRPGLHDMHFMRAREQAGLSSRQAFRTQSRRLPLKLDGTVSDRHWDCH